MPSHDDGVYAVHYIARDRWHALRAPLSVKPSQVYNALCAQLSHISVKRSKRDVRVNFGKLLPRLTADLDAIWLAFAKELESSTWASTLKRSMARWARATRSLTSGWSWRRPRK
jgi:hypothetical protein